jgi:hypothetical protein
MLKHYVTLFHFDDMFRTKYVHHQVIMSLKRFTGMYIVV